MMLSNTNEQNLTKFNTALRVGIVLTVALVVTASVYVTKQEKDGSASVQVSNKMEAQKDLVNSIGCAVPILNPQYKTNCAGWRCAFNVGKDVMPKTADATNKVQFNLNKYAYKQPGLFGYYGAYYCPDRKYASTPEITPMSWMQAMDAIFHTTTNPLFSSSAVAAKLGLIQTAMNLKGVGHMKVLDAVDVWGAWSLVLVHDTTTNHMWVDFRGTANLPGFISDGLILSRDSQGEIEGQLRIMATWIQKWRNDYEDGTRKMYGFMGYSAGVYYMTRVLVNWNIWRVGIDGFGPISLNSKLYVNVRSELDCVSVFTNEKSFPPVCIKNCPRGHLFPMVGTDCLGSVGRYWGIGEKDYEKLWCATTDAFCGAVETQPVSTSNSTQNYDVVTHGTW